MNLHKELPHRRELSLPFIHDLACTLKEEIYDRKRAVRESSKGNEGSTRIEGEDQDLRSRDPDIRKEDLTKVELLFFEDTLVLEGE